jgi:hypothetical protein
MPIKKWVPKTSRVLKSGKKVSVKAHSQTFGTSKGTPKKKK